MVRQKYRRRRHFWANLRPATLLLLIPVLISFVTFAVVGAGLYHYQLAREAAKRLETHDWQAAQQMMKDAEPNFRRKYGYYMIKPNQTLTEASLFLGVSVDSLEKDNQGSLIPGATIKVRPIERPLKPLEETRGNDLHAPPTAGRAGRTALALGIAVPLCAALLYLQLGNPAAILPPAADAQGRLTPQEIVDAPSRGIPDDGERVIW